jgi:hypothetical protein
MEERTRRDVPPDHDGGGPRLHRRWILSEEVAASAISERIAGLSLAATSAALWALGGIAAQELDQ